MKKVIRYVDLFGGPECSGYSSGCTDSLSRRHAAILERTQVLT